MLAALLAGCVIAYALTLAWIDVSTAPVETEFGAPAGDARVRLYLQPIQVDPVNDSGISRFTDGTEVLVTAHVTREGTPQEDSPGDFRQRLDLETEQIDQGNGKFSIHSGLRISIYDQRTPEMLHSQESGPAHLFRYGERLRFPTVEDR